MQDTIKRSKEPWQAELKSAITRIPDLLSYISLPSHPLVSNQHTHFPILVTTSWADRIKKGCPDDPLLLQVLPQKIETQAMPGFTQDPLEENHQTPVPGCIHKYQGRVLLTLLGQCAIHCRYCFRQHFPYQTHQFNPARWKAICAYISQDPSIYEVIFSGGDPLLLPDRLLRTCLQDIASIPHVRYVRFHTRVPIVLPSRMTDAFVQILTESRLQSAIVIHSNHPQELSPEIKTRLRHIHQQGICLLNQSVLLKGINDNAQVLANLSHALYEAGVLPYYLHRLDTVHGSQAFSLPVEEETSIVQTLYSLLPGYLVPRFVVEIPHAASKIPIIIPHMRP